MLSSNTLGEPSDNDGRTKRSAIENSGLTSDTCPSSLTFCPTPCSLTCSFNFLSLIPAPAISASNFSCGAKDQTFEMASIKKRCPFSGDNLPIARTTSLSCAMFNSWRVASDDLLGWQTTSVFTEFGRTKTRPLWICRRGIISANSLQTVVIKSHDLSDHLSN